MPAILFIVIEVQSLVLKQPLRVRLFEHVRSLLPELHVRVVFSYFFLRSFADCPAGKFVGDTDRVALSYDYESFRLLARPLDVLTFSVLSHGYV